MITAIAVSFVVGIVVSPNMATAHLDLCAQPSVNSEKSVWHALCDLETQIETIPNIIINSIEDKNECEDMEDCSKWDPPDFRQAIITDKAVGADSFIAVMTQESDGGGCTVFRGTFNGEDLDYNQFGVDCLQDRMDGSGLKYMIVNPPQ